MLPASQFKTLAAAKALASSSAHRSPTIGPAVTNPSMAYGLGRISTDTPLLILSDKDQRTLIHAMAILHARGIFVRAFISGQNNQRQKVKSKALALSLNLLDYLSFEDFSSPTPQINQSQSQSHPQSQTQSRAAPTSSSPWFFALVTSEQNLIELLAQGIAPSCAVIGDIPAATAKLLSQSRKHQLVPSLDSQALSVSLSAILRMSKAAQQAPLRRHTN